jgi:hypothetical protein
MYAQFHIRHVLLPTTTHFIITKSQKWWKMFAHQLRFTYMNYLNKTHAPSVNFLRRSIPRHYIEYHWMVRGLNPGGGEIVRTRPYLAWGPPSLLYNVYRVSFPEVKRPRRGVDHPPHLAPRLRKE